MPSIFIFQKKGTRQKGVRNKSALHETAKNSYKHPQVLYAKKIVQTNQLLKVKKEFVGNTPENYLEEERGFRGIPYDSHRVHNDNRNSHLVCLIWDPIQISWLLDRLMSHFVESLLRYFKVSSFSWNYENKLIIM